MNNPLRVISAHTVDMLRSEIDNALAPIAKKYGINNLKCGRIGYSGAEFRTTINATLAASPDESNVVKARQETLSRQLGFSSNIFGKHMYCSKGVKYKVVDINTRKIKYPIVGECVSDPSKKLLFTGRGRVFIEDRAAQTAGR